MGTAKAALPWHGSTLLARTAGVLARALDGPIIAVAAPGQLLPALPAGVEVVCDELAGRGPVHGIVAGLGAIGERSPVAFLCSTDLPFLHPAFIQAVVRRMGPRIDVVVPAARGFHQPLAAAYRVATVTPKAVELDHNGGRCPADLFDSLRVSRVSAQDLLTEKGLCAADPNLDSLTNVNARSDYLEALSRPLSTVTVQVRNAVFDLQVDTLSAAAHAVGATGRVAAVVLNGVSVLDPEPEIPLVAGDFVTILTADRESDDDHQVPAGWLIRRTVGHEAT